MHFTRKMTAPRTAAAPTVAGSPQGTKIAQNQATTRTCFMDMASLAIASDGPESSASGPS